MGRAVPSLSSPFFFLTLSLPLRFFLSSVLNMLVNLLPIESNVSLIEVVAVLSTLLLSFLCFSSLSVGLFLADTEGE